MHSSVLVPDLGEFAPADHMGCDDDTSLKLIESRADRILEEVGIRFEDDPETLDLWRQAGALIKGDSVHLNGPWLRQVIRNNTPSSFVLRARSPARNTTIGIGSGSVFAPSYGAPNVLFEDGRRCAGTLEAYRQLVSIAHISPALSNTGHMICVPEDIPEKARPLEMTLAHLSCSDKPFMGSVASPEATQQVIDAVSLAVGGQKEAKDYYLLHLINSTPPLIYKENPLKCLRVAAGNRQPCMVTSFMMMGATSPVTAVGTLIQGYAEVLAGLALTQLWAPGTPVVMGLIAIPFSMRSMAPCFGDPVSHLIQQYSVGLARRLCVPVRGDGGVTSSKIDDAQAGYEGARATTAAVMSGADFILHSTGWLESGRCVSVAKFKREAAAITASYCADTDPCNAPPPLEPALEAELRGRIPR